MLQQQGSVTFYFSSCIQNFLKLLSRTIDLSRPFQWSQNAPDGVIRSENQRFYNFDETCFRQDPVNPRLSCHPFQSAPELVRMQSGTWRRKHRRDCTKHRNSEIDWIEMRIVSNNDGAYFP